MKRTYQNITSDKAKFFLGKEVEKTPAYGLKTLFVVGLVSIDEINNILNDPFCSVGETVEHIFFGANHSFNPVEFQELTDWENLIYHFLKLDYRCSLDIPLSVCTTILQTKLIENNNFIPQIRVPIPFTKQWNYNTMLKLDDTSYNYSNPGIWTHSLHDLMDRNKFTDWLEYKDDELLS
jgi:hypothetical protein